MFSNYLAIGQDKKSAAEYIAIIDDLKKQVDELKENRKSTDVLKMDVKNNIKSACERNTEITNQLMRYKNYMNTAFFDKERTEKEIQEIIQKDNRITIKINSISKANEVIKRMYMELEDEISSINN